ncbi:MAG: site-2 protease family protein [Planctomycetota bacterium]|jgi:regulator of sigma E protease
MDFLFSGFNLLLMVLGFGVLIVVHELGHFLAAKWAGIRTEAFAVGMGPAILTWRKGIGVVMGSTHRHVVARTGKAPVDLTDQELARVGLGETEYSLRWFPIGGFVKMLGQDDVNPAKVSSDPRSYNMCPVGRRMVVVSAGVVANVLLAIALFIIAFLVGVRFEAPVVGGASPLMPAGKTRADNAEALGIQGVGLEPGDVVRQINGKQARTFADCQIASAMSKPGVPITLTVDRAGVEAPLKFTLLPEKDPASGLLGIGIVPGSSATLLEDDEPFLKEKLKDADLEDSGLRGGMRMVRAGDLEIGTYEQFDRVAQASDGEPVQTTWTALTDDGDGVGQPLEVEIGVIPDYQVLRYTDATPETVQNFELGLLGFVPLTRIAGLTEDSQNKDVLRAGDVVLRIGSIEGPRQRQFREEVGRSAGEPVKLLLWRDGKEEEVVAKVDRRGKLNVRPDYARNVPLTAEPMGRVRMPRLSSDDAAMRPTPAGDASLFGRTRINSIDGTPVGDWRQIREALRASTRAAAEAGEGASLSLEITHPVRDRPQETVTLSLSAADVEALHGLSWSSALPNVAFEPAYTTLSAGGNALRAVVMGFEETHKFILVTYLTIDRLLRGSVGIEQLRGPVGIVHIGAKIADRGITYLIFFLALISVNLAVINFLPFPILDGGLFLMLIYEKLKGRAPSLAFQNAATLVGMFLIGTALLVVTWNDLARLLS